MKYLHQILHRRFSKHIFNPVKLHDRIHTKQQITAQTQQADRRFPLHKHIFLDDLALTRCKHPQQLDIFHRQRPKLFTHMIAEIKLTGQIPARAPR